LSGIVPPPFAVSGQGATVVLRGPGRASGSLDFQDVIKENSPAEIAHWMERIMDHLQDLVTEELTEPWPSDPARPVFGRRGFELPYVTVRETLFELGYGDPRQPALELPPIEFSELGNSGGH
jgi:hypothetical protein